MARHIANKTNTIVLHQGVAHHNMNQLRLLQLMTIEAPKTQTSQELSSRDRRTSPSAARESRPTSKHVMNAILKSQWGGSVYKARRWSPVFVLSH